MLNALWGQMVSHLHGDTTYIFWLFPPKSAVFADGRSVRHFCNVAVRQWKLLQYSQIPSNPYLDADLACVGGAGVQTDA